ncbi:hypothetical protein BDR26DRAFT_1012048 [Obelidium mucronatum]|nr:hypothetical protein BDR26DRAFT_1012048 [Obelidium mucronatum]
MITPASVVSNHEFCLQTEPTVKIHKFSLCEIGEKAISACSQRETEAPGFSLCAYTSATGVQCRNNSADGSEYCCAFETHIQEMQKERRGLKSLLESSLVNVGALSKRVSLLEKELETLTISHDKLLVVAACENHEQESSTPVTKEKERAAKRKSAFINILWK